MNAPWYGILEAAGWPTDVLVLDFENYFDTEYSMRKMSTIEYIEDSRYECLGLAALCCQPGKETRATFDHDAAGLLDRCQAVYGKNLEGCTVVAQNAKYDVTILVRKYGICPPYVIDLLGLARALYPGYRNNLASICKREDLPAKGDTNQFKGLRWESRVGPPQLPPTTITRKKDKRTWIPVPGHEGWVQEWVCGGLDAEQRRALAEYAENDAAQEWAAFKLYLPRLSNPTVELRVMRQTLGLYWYPCIEVDQDLGEELATAMEAKVDEAAESVGLTPKRMRSDGFMQDLQVALGDEPVPTKQGKKKILLAIAKEDPGREYLLHHDNPEVRALMEAYIAVKSWPLHSKRVRRIMAQAMAAGGLLPVPLKYMGAHTGRWSGDEKINLQNLSKRTLIELLLRIRSLLIAPEGMRLVVTDASQIEARVLAWIAEQLDLIEAFARGTPIYCQFASEVLNQPVRKATDDDPPDLVATLTRHRNMGKVGVLGCGYGMGAPRCYDYARQVYRVDIDEDTSDAIVKHYRKKNDRIVAFWRELENAMKFVVRYPHETTELSQGRLRLYNDDGTAIIRLPNSRELYYHGMKITKTTWSGSDRLRDQLRYPDPLKPGKFNNVWGGVLTENIVQAMSRDILAEAMLLADEWGGAIGMRVGHHVHDEMIGVCPAEHAERGLEIQVEALRTVPAWAEGCPLDAEGEIKVRYGK
jgi:DNA polymerase